MCSLPIYSFYTEVFCSFVPLIYGFFSCRTQNSAYAYHLHFCWRTAYQGSAYRIPSKKVGIRRTEKGGYSLVNVQHVHVQNTKQFPEAIRPGTEVIKLQ